MCVNELVADSVVVSCACAVAWSSRYGHAYNEEAFRHFLALERARLRRVGRPFVLVVARARRKDGGFVAMDRALGRHVFSTLQRALRETDVLGWYRQGRVVAAVLTDLGDAAVAEAARVVHRRVTASLGAPSATRDRLQVRVYAVLRAPGATGELILRGVSC